MKKRFLSAAIALCIVICAVIFPSSEAASQNNDEKYDSYVNMLPNTSGHAKYIVPNLYRQDASYINVKTFPLVVNNSVEYFPLDIFALYPYLQVVYSKITHGFYINNTKNNHYVAFDMETGTTTTHDEQLLEIEARIYNRTYYVPARKVCEILEMNFETYDDPEKGIRAARISDSKAKMTLPQLVTAYSPVKKEPENTQDDPNELQNPGKEQDASKPSVDVPPDGTGEDGKNTEQQKPDGNKSEEQKPVDPYTLLTGKSLYLCFDVGYGEYTEAVLDVLKGTGNSSLFVMNGETILAMPDTVRRIIAEGHSVAIGFEMGADTEKDVAANAAMEQIAFANDALYLVAKAKTRYVIPTAGVAALYDSGFYTLAENGGLEVLSEYTRSRNNLTAGLDALVSDISGYGNRGKRSVLIRFGPERGAAGLADALLRFVSKYPQFSVVPVDEHTADILSADN